MADRFPLLTDEKIAALAHLKAWRYKHSADPAHSHTYTFNATCLLDYTLAIESATRAPLLAEIERLTQESRGWITKLNTVHVCGRVARDRIRELTLHSEGVKAQRRAAQEQVERLQAEVARLEPMRQRAGELDALHDNLHITQTALTMAHAERDQALTALRHTIRVHVVDEMAWDREAETDRRTRLALDAARKETTNG